MDTNKTVYTFYWLINDFVDFFSSLKNKKFLSYLKEEISFAWSARPSGFFLILINIIGLISVPLSWILGINFTEKTAASLLDTLIFCPFSIFFGIIAILMFFYVALFNSIINTRHISWADFFSALPWFLYFASLSILNLFLLLDFNNHIIVAFAVFVPTFILGIILNLITIKYSSPNERLFEAVIDDDNIEEVAELIKAGANVNTKSRYNDTVLMLASQNNAKNIVDLLLKNGADMYQMNDIEETAFEVALSQDYKDVVQVFIKHGLDINKKDNSGTTLLNNAIMMEAEESVKLLVESGADINTDCFLAAVYKNNIEILSFLIKNGADVNSKFSDTQTALEFAEEKGYDEVVELLIENGATRS